MLDKNSEDLGFQSHHCLRQILLSFSVTRGSLGALTTQINHGKTIYYATLGEEGSEIQIFCFFL